MVERVAVGLDAHQEAEFPRPCADGEELGVGQRLAPGQHQAEHAHFVQVVQQAEILRLAERFAGQPAVVVAVEAVEVAAVGQLQHHVHEDVVGPRGLLDSLHAHNARISFDAEPVARSMSGQGLSRVLNEILWAGTLLSNSFSRSSR